MSDGLFGHRVVSETQGAEHMMDSFAVSFEALKPWSGQRRAFFHSELGCTAPDSKVCIQSCQKMMQSEDTPTQRIGNKKGTELPPKRQPTSQDSRTNCDDVPNDCR